MHEVYISAFYMDKLKVSKELWDEVKTWGAANGYTDLPAGGGQGAQHPVQDINWYAAVKWCNARSEMEGLIPVYRIRPVVIFQTYRIGASDLQNFHVNWNANGYRLPTEAEWEKAARGARVGNTYPWGNVINTSDANYANSGDPFESDDGLAETTPVGFYDGKQWAAYATDRANGYGLYDMSGNVWEWCWDSYHSVWYDDPGAEAADTRGPLVSSSPSPGTRVLRGGSWSNNSFNLRCASRDGGSPVNDFDFLGFRSARGL